MLVFLDVNWWFYTTGSHGHTGLFAAEYWFNTHIRTSSSEPDTRYSDRIKPGEREWEADQLYFIITDICFLQVKEKTGTGLYCMAEAIGRDLYKAVYHSSRYFAGSFYILSYSLQMVAGTSLEFLCIVFYAQRKYIVLWAGTLFPDMIGGLLHWLIFSINGLM